MHVVSFVEEGDFEFVGEVADVGFSLDWVVWEGGGYESGKCVFWSQIIFSFTFIFSNLVHRNLQENKHSRGMHPQLTALFSLGSLGKIIPQNNQDIHLLNHPYN